MTAAVVRLANSRTACLVVYQVEKDDLSGGVGIVEGRLPDLPDR
jgi:hypothetical protein